MLPTRITLCCGQFNFTVRKVNYSILNRILLTTNIYLKNARVFWLLAFITAFSLAAYFIRVVYSKWNDSPVIVSFNPMDASIKDIPFPAITICSMNQAGRPEAEDIVRNG